MIRYGGNGLLDLVMPKKWRCTILQVSCTGQSELSSHLSPPSTDMQSLIELTWGTHMAGSLKSEERKDASDKHWHNPQFLPEMGFGFLRLNAFR
jgi:hypothetical protein